VVAKRCYFTVGIIGTGTGIRTHIVGFQAVPGVKVIGIVGSCLERTRHLLTIAGLSPDLACSYEDLLTAKPNLISLTTPPNQRATYLSSLGSHQGAILVEKPLAPTASLAQDLYSPLTQLQYPQFMNTQLRGLPAFRFAHKVLCSGAIGSLYSISLRERSPVLRQPKTAEWQKSATAGGGQRLALGSHLLDLGLYLADKTYTEAIQFRHHTSGVEFTPTRSAGQDGQMEAAAGEVFNGHINVAGCVIQMFTTGIGVGPRAFELDVEGTKGTLRFSFQDGKGKAVLSDDHESRHYILNKSGVLMNARKEPPKLNPSIFRIAFPHYAQDIVLMCKGEAPMGTATSLADGIANLSILDLMRDEFNSL
jgi:predicted dehydrogenase